jgi:hypothetical protein
MSLADQLNAAKHKPTSIKCQTCKILIDMDEPDRAALLAEITGSDLSLMDLERVLKAEGYLVGHKSLARHRRKECPGA